MRSAVTLGRLLPSLFCPLLSIFSPENPVCLEVARFQETLRKMSLTTGLEEKGPLGNVIANHLI